MSLHRCGNNSRARDASATSRSQVIEGLLDATYTGCCGLGLLDRDREPLLSAKRKRVESAARRAIAVEGAVQVGWYRQRARRRIQSQLDADGVTGSDMRRVAVFRADGQHELPTHRGHGASI